MRSASERAKGWRQRALCVVLILSGACLCCAVAIFYFYGLHNDAANMYPFKRPLDQDIVVIRTALIATIASSWAIWFGTRRGQSRGIVMLRSGLATLLTLVLYGVAGCGGVLGSVHGSTDFIFPSTFFSEFNFLTFIFEVAPTVAVAEALLLGLCFRWTRPDSPLPQ